MLPISELARPDLLIGRKAAQIRNMPEEQPVSLAILGPCRGRPEALWIGVTASEKRTLSPNIAGLPAHLGATGSPVVM